MDSASFRISNSMLRDWEELCPIQWKARYVDETLEWDESQAMRWGTYFETLAIGSGVKGKTVTLTHTEEKSVNNQRAKDQAKACRSYLRLRGRKLHVQRYLDADITDSEGQVIPIMGGLDIEYFFNEEGREGIIDLKFTGDVENDYGKFQWGNTDKIDCSQLLHYGLIKQFHTGEWPILEYWVFDNSAEMKQIMLRVNVEEYSIQDHIERVSKAYNEIIMAMDFTGFQPRNSFKNCNACKMKCEHERKIPELVEIYK